MTLITNFRQKASIMNQNDGSIFEISINEESQSHLRDIAKWAKFLAIIGFILGGLISLAGVLVMIAGPALSSLMGDMGIALSAMGIVYVFAGFLYIYPSLKQLRFANQIVQGFDKQDQPTITSAFQNLKSVFRYWGILTVIIIGLYVLIFIGGILFGVIAG
jgi:hypothetical protein